MPVLSVLTLTSLVILVLLGNWQYDRYAGKMAANAPEVQTVKPETVAVSIAVKNTGMAQQLYGAMDGEPVWRRYVPGKLARTDELVLVLWDATGGPQPVPLRIANTDSDFARVGTVLDRPLQRGTFAAKDDAANNLWHSMDTAGMVERLGYPAVPVRVVETVDVTVRNSADMSKARRTANPYAFEKVLDPLPPQRHFGYALTWWGMAIGLLGVYLALHHSLGRLRFRSSR